MAYCKQEEGVEAGAATQQMLQGGRFGGQSFGRGGSYDGGDRDYNRSRGNGYYRPSPRQGRGFIGNQLLRNGQNQSE